MEARFNRLLMNDDSDGRPPYHTDNRILAFAIKIMLWYEVHQHRHRHQQQRHSRSLSLSMALAGYRC